MRLALDHLAIAAPSLEEGVSYVRSVLGVEMGPGGKHPLMGTHNRLLSLGNGVYLEVIAADPEVSGPKEFKRWFGLDDADGLRRRWREGKRLAAWVARAPDIDAAIDGRFDLFGRPTELTRGDLCWRFGVRSDGEIPGGGAFPYIIEWPDGEGPGKRLPPSGIVLRELKIDAPDSPFFAHLPEKVRHFSAKNFALSAVVETPLGLVTLD